MFCSSVAVTSLCGGRACGVLSAGLWSQRMMKAEEEAGYEGEALLCVGHVKPLADATTGERIMEGRAWLF